MLYKRKRGEKGEKNKKEKREIFFVFINIWITDLTLSICNDTKYINAYFLTVTYCNYILSRRTVRSKRFILPLK